MNLYLPPSRNRRKKICCCLSSSMTTSSWLMMIFFVVVFQTLPAVVLSRGTDDDNSSKDLPPKTCAEWSGAECGWEPNLKPMTVDFGTLKETFYAYQTPAASTFYYLDDDENNSNQTAAAAAARRSKQEDTAAILTPAKFGKFINLSPQPIQVYWIGSVHTKSDKVFVTQVEPFGSSGTPAHVDDVYIVTFENQPKVLETWTIAADNSLYYYEPLKDPVKALQELTAHEQHMYKLQMQNKYFAHHYRQFTGGTDWLALYKQKRAPQYHMWRADYFGQTHSIATKEIHFVEFPSADELSRGTSVYGPRPDEIQRHRRHRDKFPTLNLTLTVMSCAPRVFEIPNFLSDIEIQHILNVALSSSSPSPSSSSPTAVRRNQDVVVDAIYRRAADVLQIDEALLRWRHKNEIPEFTESTISVAEPLELVHNTNSNLDGQHRQHHGKYDFEMPQMVHLQPSRFATILFFLNDDMDGGAITFPKWLNNNNNDNNGEASSQQAPSSPLVIPPEKGKAVLYYNLLPDGNYDERSLHATQPVTSKEQYLTNLWVWDPILDHTSTNGFGSHG